IGCRSTYGAARTTPCTSQNLCDRCTSKPKCLLWPRFCVASRNTRGTSWGWSWWRSGMTMTDRLLKQQDLEQLEAARAEAERWEAALVAAREAVEAARRDLAEALKRYDERMMAARGEGTD